jgi:hypothetical protein
MTRERRPRDGQELERVDAFERQLQALLDVEPSAGFPAALQERLSEPRPVRGRGWALPAALAAGVAALVLARTASRPAPSIPSQPQAATIGPAGGPSRVAPPPRARRQGPRAPAPPARREASAPPVIVSPEDERAVLEYLRRAHAMSAPLRLAESAPPAPAELGPPAVIDIAPLETAPLSDSAGSPARSDS